jgi:uncharacterized cupredoxin-like copper-binding protein
MYNGMRQLSSGQGRLLLIALIVFCTSACSAGGRTGAPPHTLVRVTERDFHIAATPNHVAAGDIRLVLRNEGPDTHELILVRSRSRSRLPLRPDGLTVDEEGLSALTVASLDGTHPGGERRVDLHLARGRYELFCNMAGHFMAGMHTELVVG